MELALWWMCRVGCVGMQHQRCDVRRAEMKHARFVMIDPNDRVKMMDCHDVKFLSSGYHASISNARERLFGFFERLPIPAIIPLDFRTALDFENK